MGMLTSLRALKSTSDGAAETGESEVRSYCRRFDRTFATAQGSYLIDEAGRRYIDFLAGASALNYGHNDPDMIAGLVDYISQGGVIHGLDLRTKAKARFIDVFESRILAPRSRSYRLQFCGPTGTNAIEAALKLARKVTGRSQVVAFTNGFHGMTLGALAATGNSHHRMQPSLQLPGVTRAFYDGYFGADVDTAKMLDQALSDPSSGFDKPAAILLETVQGEGGVNAASPQWLKSIAEIAKRHGALLIVDDIQAGCGRAGRFFSFEEFGLEPDIVTMAKSLSGLGLPMALVLIRPDLDQWAAGEHNGTFRGNNAAFVTASIAIEKFWCDDGLVQRIGRSSRLVRNALSKMARLVPGSRVKGRGMLQGLDVLDGKVADAVSRRCFDTGLIIETCGPHDEVLKVLAPLTSPDDVLREGLRMLEAAIVQVVGRLEAKS